MASTSAATTTKHQAHTYLMEPTTSDDDSQVMAATSVVTTKQQPIFDLVEATKSDEEAKAAAATSVATTNQEANSDLKEAAKSHGEAKAITPTPVATTNEQANLDLRDAAKSDDQAKAVAALTQWGVDVNCRGNPGYRFTPLILAIQSNNVKVARVLLADPRVDVNATDSSGQTAVHHSRPNALIAIILSQRTGIDWNVVDKTGRTPLLSFARRNGLREIQDLSRIKSVDLFARSIDGFTALHEVAEQESPFPTWFKKAPPTDRCTLLDGLFEALEARGHDLVSFVNATDVLNRSAPHYIAEEGSEILLKRLLEKCPAGISVTGVDCHGFTPLHLAVRRGQTAVVELLLLLPCMDANVGATVNACIPSGLKP
jgi:ankyrin repeat protein